MMTMRIFLVALACVFVGVLSAEDAWPDQNSLIKIRHAAAHGEPHSQLLMGILLELGYGVPQNLQEAAIWYSLAAHSGDSCAFKRLGLMLFFGNGVPQHKDLGTALILLSLRKNMREPFDRTNIQNDLLQDLKEEDLDNAEYIAEIWDAFRPEYKPISLLGASYPHESRLKMNRRRQPELIIKLASDRPDPQDANDRFYGPGTGEWNIGISRSEYEQIQREQQALLVQINDLRAQAEALKLHDLRNKIDKLQTAKGSLQRQALDELLTAIRDAMTAGVTIVIPPLALYSAYEAVGHFKNSADRYIESIQVEKEVHALLRMEESLKKAESFGRRER